MLIQNRKLTINQQMTVILTDKKQTNDSHIDRQQTNKRTVNQTVILTDNKPTNGQSNRQSY